MDLGDGAEGPAAAFAQVVLPGVEVEAVEYRQGNDRDREPGLVAGVVRNEPVILRRGIDGSLRLWRWRNARRNGDDARRNVTITLLNEIREPVLAVRLFRVVRFALPLLDTGGGAVAVEELTLVYERLELE